jgi:transglutaminase-like putative cysteine protease
MKRLRGFSLFCALSLLLLARASAIEADTERLYFAIEVKGAPCGYSEIELSPLEKDGRELILLKHRVFMMLSALGAEFNSEADLTYHIDPESGQFTYHDSEVKQGQMELWSKVYIEGDKARLTSSSAEEQIIDLPPGVILENTLINSYLVRDLYEGDLDQKTYDVLEVMEGEVQQTTYRKVYIENLALAGHRYEALVLDAMKQKTGLKYRVWIDTETGYTLKSDLPNDRVSYRTGPSIKKRIQTANLDDVILSRVNVLIADFQAISYMKVKATIEPSGLRVTSESLNVPGQSFTGTVEDNLIDGIFEIEHEHYGGVAAPTFPPDFSEDQHLREYLDPGDFIESDDPVLIGKAQEISKGSKDSWEAVVRLSEWVADNIGYAIPGGATARKTYDIKAGECGAHSFLLAAFCRAVGIPARVVWGCMYVSNRGGSFGQHAWNEIYMGDAGWIPVDATVLETDYLDSGHIRFGIYRSPTTSFNPHKMEILDYRVASGNTVDDEDIIREKYEAYLGRYELPGGDLELKVFIQDGNLTVDIPGRVTLPFADPDKDGNWHCKMTNRLYTTFEKDDAGKVTAMNLHELVTMPRTSDPEEADEDIPEEFRPYLGKYLFPQHQAEFTVLYRDGGLAIYDPLKNETIGLQAPDEKGRWLDEFNKNTIFFDIDHQSEVTAMNIDAVNKFRRR